MLIPVWTIAGVIVSAIVGILIPSAVTVSGIFTKLAMQDYRIGQVETAVQKIIDTLQKFTDTSARMETKLDTVIETVKSRPDVEKTEDE